MGPSFGEAEDNGTNFEDAQVDRSRPEAPHDLWFYRLAVGGVSVSLVTFLIGAAIVGATGHAAGMVNEYWVIGAGLAGALVGIIAPSPAQRRPPSPASRRAPKTGLQKVGGMIGGSISGSSRLLTPLWQPLALAAVLALTLWQLAEVRSGQIDAVLRTLAAGSAGALLGLLAPPPGGAR